MVKTSEKSDVEVTSSKRTTKKSLASSEKTKKTSTKKSTREGKLAFSAHIERIKEAKELSDSVSAKIPLDTRAASVALLWEIVFDVLCNSAELDISDFNTVAGIIQKLASARVSEIPTSESRSGGITDCSISAETLAKIEEQLKLL